MSGLLGLIATGISVVHEGIYMGLLGMFGMTESDQGTGLIVLQFLSCVILACILILPPSILCYSIKQCLSSRGEVRAPRPATTLTDSSHLSDGADSSATLENSYQIEFSPMETKEEESL